ncbi:3-deoxy-7-phosphoheptulonate synthase [Auritidibacter ignavus]|uniref:3-deoxy-7-phosphoheptulonate synthase n=1 Tax=Auritidibacter ignavus TaxID=678932 RepID=UPI003CC5A6B3
MMHYSDSDLLAEARTLIQQKPALQQPHWSNQLSLIIAKGILHSSPPLVTETEILDLQGQLSGAANGSGLVLQAGDCAEPLSDTSTTTVYRKADLLHRLGTQLNSATGKEIIHIGRIAGQFSDETHRKSPRSKGSCLTE